MYQAIITKWIGPTNTRGSKIKARCAGGSVTLHYDDALNLDENHRVAAQRLREKMQWDKLPYVSGMIGGTIFDGRMVWVFTGVQHV